MDSSSRGEDLTASLLILNRACSLSAEPATRPVSCMVFFIFQAEQIDTCDLWRSCNWHAFCTHLLRSSILPCSSWFCRAPQWPDVPLSWGPADHANVWCLTRYTKHVMMERNGEKFAPSHMIASMSSDLLGIIEHGADAGFAIPASETSWCCPTHGLEVCPVAFFFFLIVTHTWVLR